jgi:Na+-translocating ferredoxin:NAD+ oxidoreductase RnfD subunit
MVDAVRAARNAKSMLLLGEFGFSRIAVEREAKSTAMVALLVVAAVIGTTILAVYFLGRAKLRVIAVSGATACTILWFVKKQLYRISCQQ